MVSFSNHKNISLNDDQTNGNEVRGLRSNVGKKQKPSYNDAKILFERQFIVKFLKTPIISYRKVRI